MFKTYYNNYYIVPDKKYLVLFYGCFALPHKGHFSTIKPFLNKENVKVIIYLGGNQAKHNVPRDVSLAIWNVYLKKVTNAKVMIFDDYKYVYENMNVDRLLILRGIESHVTDKFIKELHGKVLKKFRQKYIKTDVLLTNRICSSTETLKNLDNIFFYLPSHISTSDKEYIKNIVLYNKNIN